MIALGVIIRLVLVIHVSQHNENTLLKRLI